MNMMIFCNQKKVDKDATIQVMRSELMPCIGQSCQTPAGGTELTPASSQTHSSRTLIQMQMTAVETKSGRKLYFEHYSQDL